MLDPTQALDALIAGFADALLEKDDYFLQNMQTKNLAGDNISHYQFWEWPQGVGLFALALLWQHTNDPAML
nr:hypothetical protein [Sphaerochaeta sp.]